MAEEALSLVTLLGCLGRDSPIRAIANTLDELAPNDAQVSMPVSIADLPLFNEDRHYLGIPSDVIALSDAITGADGVIIVTPEYGHSLPGGLKNALDWLGRLPDQPFAGKPVAIQTASEGEFGGIRAQLHLREMLAALDAAVLNKPEIAISHILQKIDGVTALLRDEEARQQIAHQLLSFAQFIRGERAFGSTRST